MQHIFKPFFLIFLGLSFSFISCSSDEEIEDEDFKGIKVATTRSSGESEGIGLACNFSMVLEEYLDEEDFDEILDELEEVAEEAGEEFDRNEFDDFFEDLFGSFDQTMYIIVAGDDLELENEEFLEVGGEAFSITWFSDSEEPAIGTYEAEAVKINVEDPENFEENAELSTGTITVELTELTEEFMIGTFEGTVENDEGVSEAVSGSFNVDRESCG